MKKGFVVVIMWLFCLGATVSAKADTDLSYDEEYMVKVILNNSNVEVSPTASYRILDTAGNNA